MVKFCKKCNNYKELSSFGPQKTTKDGLKSWCKTCFAAYLKEWKNSSHYQFPSSKYKESTQRLLREKRKYIQKARTKPCAKCGIQLDTLLMDFDHLHSKRKNLAAMTVNSYKKINQEIAKCQVLCIFCHKEKTHLSKKPETIPTTTKKLKRFIDLKWKQRFSILARSKSCYLCQKSYPYYQMELDHQSQFQKLENVSKLIFLGADDSVILKEIAKTKPICCACHRLKSIQEKLSTDNIKNKLVYQRVIKPIAQSGNKICPQCKKEKGQLHFYQNGWCKECFSRYRKQKRKR